MERELGFVGGPSSNGLRDKALVLCFAMGERTGSGIAWESDENRNSTSSNCEVGTIWLFWLRCRELRLWPFEDTDANGREEDETVVGALVGGSGSLKSEGRVNSSSGSLGWWRRKGSLSGENVKPACSSAKHCDEGTMRRECGVVRVVWPTSNLVFERDGV